MKHYIIEYPCGKNSRLYSINELEMNRIIAALKMQEHLKDANNADLINHLEYVKGKDND